MLSAHGGVYFGLLNCLDTQQFQFLVSSNNLELGFVSSSLNLGEILFTEWVPGDLSWFEVSAWGGITMVWNWSVHYYFLVFYLVYLFVKLIVDLGTNRLQVVPAFSVFVELYLSL